MKKRMLILLASAILVLSACGKKIDNAGTASATAGDGASSAQVIQGETKAAGSAAGDDASAEEEGAAPSHPYPPSAPADAKKHLHLKMEERT